MEQSGTRSKEQQRELFERWDNGRRINRVTPIGPIRGPDHQFIFIDDLPSTHRRELTDEEREAMREWWEDYNKGRERDRKGAGESPDSDVGPTT